MIEAKWQCSCLLLTRGKDDTLVIRPEEDKPDAESTTVSLGTWYGTRY